MIIKDPRNVRQPLPLAIKNRRSDGSYLLGTITMQSFNVADISPDTVPDGKVDIFDFNKLLVHFGETGSVGWIKSDIVKNGKVDIFDFNKLVENFGQ